VQHRKTEAKKRDDSSRYYRWEYTYKNYVLTFDVSDPMYPARTGDYNIPGRMIGASGSMVYTLSNWVGDENSNVTLNSLRLKDGKAQIESAFIVGTGWVDGMVKDGKAYIVNRAYHSRYWFYSNNAELNTTFQVIDLMNPKSPRQMVSMKFWGNINIKKMDGDRILLQDQTHSALIVYSIHSDYNSWAMEFEAMVLLNAGPSDMRVVNDVLYIAQGYHGVTTAGL
jgi:hypothetical protein